MQSYVNKGFNMQAFKILKHDKKDFIYILDLPENHKYIRSLLIASLTAFKSKIESDFNVRTVNLGAFKSSNIKMDANKFLEPNDIIDMLIGEKFENNPMLSQIPDEEAINITLNYAKSLNSYVNKYNIVEKISIIESVYPNKTMSGTTRIPTSTPGIYHTA